MTNLTNFVELKDSEKLFVTYFVLEVDKKADKILTKTNKQISEDLGWSIRKTQKVISSMIGCGLVKRGSDNFLRAVGWIKMTKKINNFI